MSASLPKYRSTDGTTKKSDLLLYLKYFHISGYAAVVPNKPISSAIIMLEVSFFCSVTKPSAHLLHFTLHK